MAREPWEAMALGNEILVSLAVGWGAGAWLDRLTDLQPICTLAGVGLGLGAAVKGVVRTIRAYERSTQGGTRDDSRTDDGSR
jgi:F0F1-type ATP synthase assembly protein I